MDTVVQRLRKGLEEMATSLEEFLIKHSRIHYDPIDYHGILIIPTFSDYHWGDLSTEGRKLQNRLLRDYRRLLEFCTALLADHSEETKRRFQDCSNEVLEYIEQNGQIWEKSTRDVVSRVLSCLATQSEILETLYDPRPGSHILVPDTNALLGSPSIEQWSFDEFPTFELLLTPTVLSELDKLKVGHRDETVRAKSRDLIRQLKEYRRRGELTEGVAIVKNRISLRALAVEPRLEAAPSWLDMTNNDDRILATILETMRMHPHSVVVLVTGDINMQNKADYARIPFLEPPEWK